MTPDELRVRTKTFAINIIRLCKDLPKDSTSQEIAGQLADAGTAVGSNKAPNGQSITGSKNNH